MPLTTAVKATAGSGRCFYTHLQGFLFIFAEMQGRNIIFQKGGRKNIEHGFVLSSELSKQPHSLRDDRIQGTCPLQAKVLLSSTERNGKSFF